MNRTHNQESRWRTSRLLLLFCLLSASMMVSAQEYKVVQDLHLWTGAQIEKKIGKDWTIFLGEEIRFKHDISEINNHFTETGLNYRINKNFALEGQYRITRDKNKYGNYETLTRYAFDLRFKGKIDFITIYYRLRYQKEVEGWNLIDPEIPYQKYLRHRITIRYNQLNRIIPYFSAEIFQLFEPSHIARYEYTRILGGIKYKLAGSSEFNLAYGFNRELNTFQPATYYLFKINYTFSF